LADYTSSRTARSLRASFASVARERGGFPYFSLGAMSSALAPSSTAKSPLADVRFERESMQSVVPPAVRTPRHRKLDLA